MLSITDMQNYSIDWAEKPTRYTPAYSLHADPIRYTEKAISYTKPPISYTKTAIRYTAQ